MTEDREEKLARIGLELTRLGRELEENMERLTDLGAQLHELTARKDAIDKAMELLKAEMVELGK